MSIIFDFESFRNGFVLGMGLIGFAGLLAVMFKSARRLFNDIAK